MMNLLDKLHIFILFLIAFYFNHILEFLYRHYNGEFISILDLGSTFITIFSYILFLLIFSTFLFKNVEKPIRDLGKKVIKF